MSRRQTAIAAAAAMLVLGLAVVGSAVLRDEPRPKASPSAVAGPACASRDGKREHLYVIAGPDPNNAALYPLSLCPLRLEAPLGLPRVSWVSANGDVIAVGEASNKTDHLALVEGGQFVAIPGLGRPSGFGPEVSADGRIAYIAFDPASRQPGLLNVWDPKTRRSRLVYRSTRQLGSVAWGPHGELAVVEGVLAPEATLTVIDSTGRRRVAAELPSSVLNAKWAPGRDLLLIRTAGKAPTFQASGFLLDLATKKQTPLPDGWSGMAWSPDGRDLLLTRYSDRALGLLTGPAYTDVVLYGSVEGGPVSGAAWVAD